MNKKIREILNKSPAELKKARREAKRAAKRAAKDAFIERDALGRYQKGFSGNNLGRPRTALAVLCREQVTKHGLVKVLGSIAARDGEYARKSKIPVTISDQINAIRLLLLYGFGIPKHEIDAADGVRIEVSYSDNRQVNFTNAASGSEPGNRGVKTIQHSVLRPKVGQDNSGDEPTDPPSVEW